MSLRPVHDDLFLSLGAPFGSVFSSPHGTSRNAVAVLSHAVTAGLLSAVAEALRFAGRHFAAAAFFRPNSGSILSIAATTRPGIVVSKTQTKKCWYPISS